MQNLWQKKLKLSYSKDIFDIVQFGSSVIKEKEFNDIDIAVIFYKIPLREQLNKSQKIKKQLQKISEVPIHIKSFDLYSLFDESNFSRENILFYGKSLISAEYFSEKFGVNPKIQILYNLSNFKKKDKVRFHYMLKGKKGKYGLLRKHGGDLIKPGLIEISPDCENIFINSIKNFTNRFKVRKILF